MRIVAKKRRNESYAALLRRFMTRFQRSGVVLEVRRGRYRRKESPKLTQKKSRLYRLRVKKFVAGKMKEGWPVEKALALARKYVQYHKAI